MPRTMAGSIETAFTVEGEGPALLLFAPGGFGAVRSNWTDLGVYKRLGLLPSLREHFTCITFDRREAGESGGRVERISWAHYVQQGLDLLDHLDIERAAVMGGCIGSSIAAATALAAPERVSAMILYSPAGGVHYRMGQHRRFVTHLAYAAEHGLAGVVELARSTEEGFSKDPRVGPWCSVIRREEQFAADYAALDPSDYATLVTGLVRLQFDRDSVPGVEPEDLVTCTVPSLIVPGDDPSHAPSAAHFLSECLPKAQLWDIPVKDQQQDNVSLRLIDFLRSAAN